jgi:hypothetical protein
VTGRLTAKDESPSSFRRAAPTPLGALGYSARPRAAAAQARRDGCTVDELVVPFGTGGTFAGICSASTSCASTGASPASPSHLRAPGSNPASSPTRRSRRDAGPWSNGLHVSPRSATGSCSSTWGPPTERSRPDARKPYARRAHGRRAARSRLHGQGHGRPHRLVRRGEIEKGHTVVSCTPGGRHALFAHPELAKEKAPSEPVVPPPASRETSR